MLPSFKRFDRDTDGAMALMAALAAIPLMGMAGFAVDYGRWQYDQAKLQSITDASALAGAMYLGEGHTNVSEIKAVVEK